MMQGQDYKMDTSKFPNQLLSTFDGLSKICEGEFAVVMENDANPVDQF